MASVNSKLLLKLNTMLNDYRFASDSYFTNSSYILTSMEIFKNRKVLNKMSSILIYLFKYNRELIYFIQNLWCSIDYEDETANVKLKMKYLRIVTFKFLRLNNKLNIMNLAIEKVSLKNKFELIMKTDN